MHAMRQFFMLAALILGLSLLGAPDARAEEANTSTSAMETECGKHVGVTNRIAGCVRETVTNIADRFFDQDDGFYKLVSRFVAAVLTLGVAIYGVMAAGGMIEKVGRDTMMFLVKVSFIAYFAMHADVMYNYSMRAMDAAGAAVVQVTPKYGMADGNKDFSDIQCFKAMQAAAVEAGKPVVGPWLAMDCLIDTVFGIKTYGTNRGGMSTNIGVESEKWFNDKLEGKGLQRGLLFFFFSGLKTSVVGIILGVLGFVFMWGIVAMIMKSLLTYLAGYIGLAFMMIISPIFIPLALFRETKSYFDKWVKLSISFALQPVLILLFVSLSIAAVDLALFSGDYSVMYRIAGEASRAPSFSLNKYLTENEAVISAPVVAAYASSNDQRGDVVINRANSIMSNIALGKCTEEKMRTDPDCAGMPLQVYRDTIDWKKLAEIRKPPVRLSDGAERVEQQISREVLAAAIFCGVVIFIMNRLMAVVPHILVDLIGDFGQTPNLFNRATEQWGQAAQSFSGQASGTLKQAFASMSGQRRGPG